VKWSVKDVEMPKTTRKERQLVFDSIRYSRGLFNEVAVPRSKFRRLSVNAKGPILELLSESYDYISDSLLYWKCDFSQSSDYHQM